MKDPVEVARMAVASFNHRRGIEMPTPGELPFDPAELEIIPLRAALEGTVYRPPNALEDFLRDNAESWADLRMEPRAFRRIRQSEDVLIDGQVKGTARETQMPVEVDLVWLFTARDGRMTRMATHLNEADAIRGAARWRLGRARLYFVCEARPHGRDPRPLLDAAIRGGAGIVQLRDKDLGDVELVEAARPFREAADAGGALFILNDRPHLVGPCAADGVHVGQDDLPVARARALAGEAALVGLSTHGFAEVEDACSAEGEARPDQISVGPVWETPTKEGRPGTGLGLIEFAARAATIPWFAIGGIDAERAVRVAAAGARRAVVVRAIRDAADPEATARSIAGALAGADRETAA